MRKLRKKEQEQSEAQGSVADNPEQAHPSDQEADLQGIGQNMAPDKSPETPEGAETAEPMYEQMEGDDYLEAILAKLEELERRISDIEGPMEEQVDESGLEQEPMMAEEEPMMAEEEPMMAEEPTPVVEEEEPQFFERKKRIEQKAKRLFVPKRKVERRMTKRISTLPMGRSAESSRNSLKEFLGSVTAEAKRL